MLESAAAVGMLPVEVDVGPPGHRRASSVTAALAEPLAGWILLDGRAPLAMANR